ncbi:DNA repair protein RecO [Hespellia stercorisuis]|uniref:DNA repair protein RecO n=1 Tax=Hespellia stercorisuis DSM 15480 TaxID=1121950 RepID=A0A1M6KNP6_9FIRM|nr:DNA repair protein RecO [Hespellia stercorisuis]SHJ60555.1 DNA replication and repair protein RecO [Hespellia stercorisuis DSM 15480]
MDQIVVTGMVLSSAPIGEYDRRVVLLTKEQGKISAFAKGARRPNSALVGAINPFTFGEYTLYAGRNSFTMQSAHITNYFAELREDMEGAYYGFYFLELANYYAKEANDETQMLKLLYVTMRALAKKSIPRRLVRCIYELRLICINGEGPQVFQCVNCGDSTRPAVFSARKGGLICSECSGDVIDGMVLDSSTLYSMQFIESTKVEHLYTFTVKEEVLELLERIMKRYMDVYVEKRFHSLEILEQLDL